MSERYEPSNRVKVIKKIDEEDFNLKKTEFLETVVGKNAFSMKENYLEDYGDDLIYETGYNFEAVKNEIDSIWNMLIEDGFEDPRQEAKAYYQYATNPKTGKTEIQTIPNVYHYIWYDSTCNAVSREFDLHHFASFVSLVKHAKVDKILFHTDCEPRSAYWEAYKCFIQNYQHQKIEFKIIKTKQIKTVWNKPIVRVEHRVDIYKLMLMFTIGGIYIDDDILTLAPYEELLTRNGTENLELLPVLGEESEYAVSNAFIASLPEQEFIARWYYAYQPFRHGMKFGRFSVINAWILWRKYPDLVNVIEQKFIRPNWQTGNWMMTNYTLFNWMLQYNIHLQPRFFRENGLPDGKLNLRYLISVDNVLGEILRYTLIGRWRPLREDCSQVSRKREYDKNHLWYEKGAKNIDIWYDEKDKQDAGMEVIEEDSID